MFYFRLNKVVIFDNGAIKPFLGIFGHDFADVKFLSFVTPSNLNLPAMDEFLRTTDPNHRTTLLADAIRAVIASRELTQVSRVTDHANLTFGDTGYVLYESETIPESFSWTCLAIKSNQRFRDVGEHTREVIDDPGFGGFATNLLSLASSGASAVNPAYAAGIAVAKFVTQIVAQNMKRAGDQQLGLVYMSLDRAQHYAHGDRKVDAMRDLTGNMAIDYSIFAFERAIAVNGGESP